MNLDRGKRGQNGKGKDSESPTRTANSRCLNRLAFYIFNHSWSCFRKAFRFLGPLIKFLADFPTIK
ncbi:hypothetical protein QQP08_018114 [Theobroma cacao]|nr:hypothetical protein QQP08_018114 [Theobroma cacao]